MSEDIVGQIKDIKGRTWQEAFYIQTKAFLEKNSEHLKEIEHLKAEVERLTAFTTRTIIPNEELQAQVERLTLASQGAVKYVEHTMALTRQSMEHHKQVSRLEAQVERLTKAGDAMASQLYAFGYDTAWDFWNAAKEGKPRD
jgi:predicted  nucleic acid-binding Zn-ribbon protein